MKKFADRLRPESGFTVIELIAALTIFAMVVGLITAVTMFGFRNYNKITTENGLREEADIVMSSIMTELYTFGPDYIENLEDSRTGIVLVKGEGGSAVRRIIEIAQGRLVIDDLDAPPAPNDPRTADGFDLSGSQIQSFTADGRWCRPKVCDSGLIDISLLLSQKDRNGHGHQLELESKFGF